MKQISLREAVNPTPQQKLFLDTVKTHSFVLFGGAAGGGKSYILRWMSVLTVIYAYTLHGVRNTVFGLFCEDYPALQQRHLVKWNIPRELGTIAESRKEGLRFKLREELGGGMVLLGNLDDPAKYDSAEFIGVAVDEWCKNPWSVFEQLRKRLRWAACAEEPHLPCGGHVANKKGEVVDCPIKSHHTQPAWNFPFAKGSNPAGPGHAETKRVYVDRKFTGTVAHLAPLADQFAYVPSLSSDNPYNPLDYKEKNLDTLPAGLRAAYAEGRWDVPEGQFFTNFDRQKVEISPQAVAALVQDWWPAWMATDWGFQHWCVTFWATRGLVTPEQAEQFLGRKWQTARYVVIIYREFACRELDSPVVAQALVDKTHPLERPGIKHYFLSPDAKQKKSSQHTHSEEIGAVMAKAKMPEPEDADNQRVAGWRFCYSMFERDEIFISSECPVLMDALPQLQYVGPSGSGDPEDIAKTEDISDDAGDAFRYLLKSMLDPRIKAPLAVRAAQEAGKWQHDPSTLAIRMREFEIREKAAGKTKRRWRGH